MIQGMRLSDVDKEMARTTLLRSDLHTSDGLFGFVQRASDLTSFRRVVWTRTISVLVKVLTYLIRGVRLGLHLYGFRAPLFIDINALFAL